MREALLIIDVQNDYFTGGKCELYQPEQTLESIGNTLTYFRENNYPVFFIQHISPSNATFFIPNTEGVEIHKKITPLESEQVIIKHTPNSFFDTELQHELQKLSITNLVVCGMMTHMCVDTTVRAARYMGYQVTLLSDTCTTKDLEWNGSKIPANIVQDV
ncbi:cysteine hydrolase family protein, partial [Anaerosporobacter sp.]|uniref:cysteine hydrolase family protein n=1 Tax=Anaerosporobacter sp. TaxID=1872529 RepID=UPI00286F8501